MKSFLHRLRPTQKDKENIKDGKARPASMDGGAFLKPQVEREKAAGESVATRKERLRHSTQPATVTAQTPRAEKRKGLMLDREKMAAAVRSTGGTPSSRSPIRASEGESSPLWNGAGEGIGDAYGLTPEQVVRRVAFVSPVPTPGTSTALDAIPDISTDVPPEVPAKDTVRRMAIGRRTPTHTPQVSVDSTKTRNSVRRPSSVYGAGSVTNQRPPARKPSLPHNIDTSRKLDLHRPGPASSSSRPQDTTIGRKRGESIDSSNTVETSESSVRAGAFCPVQASWSEMAESDLIDNLSPRERTRQEVLWEIVSSEERYVAELMKLKETFIDALIPPRDSSTPVIPAISSPTLSTHLENGPASTYDARCHGVTPASERLTSSPLSAVGDNFSYLPIASRFASPRPDTPSDNIPDRGASTDTTGEQSTGSRASHRPMLLSDEHKSRLQGHYAYLTNGRPSTQDLASRYARGHHSLPPPPRSTAPETSTLPQSVSLTQARMSLRPSQRMGSQNLRHDLHGVTVLSDTTSGVASPPLSAKSATSGSHKLRKRFGSRSELVRPTRLVVPEELKKVLEVLGNGIMQGHVALSTALKRRYDTQYPLVRSLADVFISHSAILREYDTYILHLEKALQQIEDSHAAVGLVKGLSSADRNSGMREKAHLGQALQILEDIASDRGESGLIISLSKPFQRLVKYPLLFQNLLFNTDPSTKEYEATILMVEEVEEIVRSIEDEKTAKEVRDKTRDALARIEGLENEKGLMAPKATRLLVEEHPLDDERSAAEDLARRHASVKNKKSLKRLSDILKGNGSTAAPDLWVVAFTDVSLLCQKVGSTVLPLGSRKSAVDAQANGKKASTVGRRSTQIQPRNLYKFIKVEQWFASETAAFRYGLLNMSEISRIRSGDNPNPISPIDPNPSDSDNESDASDNFSRMSFAFGVHDSLRPLPLPIRHGGGERASRASTGSTSGRLTAPTFASLQRRSETGIANSEAKFAGRLRSSETVGAGVGARAGSGMTHRSGAPSRTSLAGVIGAANGTGTVPTRQQRTSLGPERILPRPGSAGGAIARTNPKTQTSCLVPKTAGKRI